MSDDIWIALGQSLAAIIGFAGVVGMGLLVWRFFDDVHAIRRHFDDGEGGGEGE